MKLTNEYTETIHLLASSSKGFGINTDIFETNILNLAVVIGVLIYYGRAILSETIETRKITILKSLEDAENKFKEAEKNLLFAKKNLSNSELKAEEIRNQAITVSNQAFELIINNSENEIKRLKSLNLAYILFEQGKSVGEVCKKLNQSALDIALQKLKKKLNKNMQKKIIRRKINKLNSKLIVRK